MFSFITLSLFFNVIRTDQYCKGPECSDIQYIYPVAEINDDSLLVMRQRSLYDIELLQWSKSNKEAHKVLWSIYMPSSVVLLPGKQAFSFIDQGRIRIKYFNKRSPKTINIYEPITTFDSIQWIDDETFYFTAQDPHFHNVFVCEFHKNVASISRLTFQEESDFLYPQKVDDSLFAIKRDNNEQFTIVELLWQERAFENYKEVSEETIIKNDKCCCFLQMTDKENGHFISYSPFKDEVNSTYTFYCNELTKKGSEWNQEELFSFEVHEKFITGKGSSRLYESIKPLLPRYEKCGIFFSHFNSDLQSCSLKKYNKATKLISTVPSPRRRFVSLFTPLFSNGEAFCGMMIKTSRSALEKHRFNGEFQFDIYEIEDTSE